MNVLQFNSFNPRPQHMHTIVHFSVFDENAYTHSLHFIASEHAHMILIKYNWKSLFVDTDKVRLVSSKRASLCISESWAKTSTTLK